MSKFKHGTRRTDNRRIGNSPQQVDYAMRRLGQLRSIVLQGSLNLLVEEVIKAWLMNLLHDG